MSDYNNVGILGRLTRDPELSYTGNQTPICKFSIANNKRGTNGQDEVNFFDIVAWSKVATNCSQYLKKGSQVLISGRLEQNRYQDKTGQNRSSITVVAVSVQFIGSKDNGIQNNQGKSSDTEFKDFD